MLPAMDVNARLAFLEHENNALRETVKFHHKHLSEANKAVAYLQNSTYEMARRL